MSQMHRVFVYGTLRKGQPNHRLLTACKHTKFIGECNVAGLELYDTGLGYPAVMLNSDSTRLVVGEVYEVTYETRCQLDKLEGFPHHYDRTTIATRHGHAWFYFQDPRQLKRSNCKLIQSGDWLNRDFNKFVAKTVSGSKYDGKNLLQRIADRAGELASCGVVDLRLAHPDNTEGTKSGAQWRGVTKARLIADILFDEFESEVE